MIPLHSRRPFYQTVADHFIHCLSNIYCSQSSVCGSVGFTRQSLSTEYYHDYQTCRLVSILSLSSFTSLQQPSSTFHHLGKCRTVSTLLTQATSDRINSKVEGVANITRSNDHEFSQLGEQQQQEKLLVQQHQQQQPRIEAPLAIHRRKSSLVGERVATQNFEHMQHFTNYILNQQYYHSRKTCPQAIRHAVTFWLSDPVRRLCEKRSCPDLPMECTSQLVEWLFSQFDAMPENNPKKLELAAVIENVLAGNNYDSSVSHGLTRLVALALRPLQGTRAALLDRGHRPADTIKANFEALKMASRICDLLERVQADNYYFPHLQPDGQSCQSQLNLVGKRCKFITQMGHRPVDTMGKNSPRIRRGIKWTDPDTILALGECKTPRDCIDVGLAFIQRMKERADFPNPGPVHYSTLFTMYSFASRLSGGFADEAYHILKGIEQDPNINDFGSAALYNPVLLAYHNEAELYLTQSDTHQAMECKQKAEALFERIRNHRGTMCTADPVTYSLMITMYKDLDQAQAAQRLLDDMEDATTKQSKIDTRKGHVPTPTLLHYNGVLNAWAKSTSREAATKAGELLRRMEQRSRASPYCPRPDKISYTTALDAVLRASGDDEMMEKVETLLTQFEANTHPKSKPDAVTYSMLFQQFFDRIEKRSDMKVKEYLADQMETLLRRLMQQSHHFRTIAKTKLYRYYNDCLRAWGYSGSPLSLDRALLLLKEMEEVGQTIPAALPNAQSFQSFLATAVSNPSIESLNKVREVFQQIEARRVPRTIVSLNFFLQLLIQCPFQGSPHEVNETFSGLIMERLNAEVADAFTHGWVFEGIFHYMLNETNTSKKEDLAIKSEALFRFLLKNSEHFRTEEGQQMYMFYNGCLRAWAFAHSRESPKHTIRLLEEMIAQDNNSALICRPDVKTYEYVLTSLSREVDADCVEKARMVFQKMDESNTPITLSLLNTLFRILARSETVGALEEAEQILNKVESKFLAGMDSICPNRSSYEILIQGYSRYSFGMMHADRIVDHMKKVAELTGDKDLLPTEEMYKGRISAWMNSKAPDAMDRVEENFQKMAELYMPNSEAYATLQEAWSQSMRADAAQHVESILVKMQNEFDCGKNIRAKPTIDNFNIVIKAWATCTDPASAERADAILKRLEDIYNFDRELYREMMPSVISYANVLLGWSLSNSPEAAERAEALLNRMNQAREDRPSLWPSRECYNYVLAALTKSQMPRKAERCFKILNEMLSARSNNNAFAQPTHESYFSVFRACASSTTSEEEKISALDILTKTMGKYIEHYKHNGVRMDGYVLCLYALFRLLPEGEQRDDAVAHIFTDEKSRCPSTYLKNATILDALTKTVSLPTFTFILKQCA